MINKKYCSGCKEEFKDGEFVAVSGDEFYHHIVRDLESEPIDCAIKVSMDRLMVFIDKIHYKSDFYKFEDVAKLPNHDKLTVGFNENKNGDIIIGSLEGLVK